MAGEESWALASQNGDIVSLRLVTFPTAWCEATAYANWARHDMAKVTDVSYITYLSQIRHVARPTLYLLFQSDETFPWLYDSWILDHDQFVLTPGIVKKE